MWPRADSTTIMLATEPRIVRLPAKVVASASTFHINSGCAKFPTHFSATNTNGTFEKMFEPATENHVQFHVCAVALERNRKAAREIRGRGHDVVSHGYRWEDVTLLSREQEREHIRLAVASITETTGERPSGWYCRYGPSVNTRELVVEEGGFLYDSDAYNDDLPYWTMVGGKKHLVIPYSLVNNDSRFAQGHFGAPESFEEHLRYTFDRLYKEGATHPKMMSIGLHMRVAGHPARAQAVYKFIEYAKSFPGVWFARRIEIAKHWQENHA